MVRTSENRRRYNQSEKGQATQKRYNQTKKHKLTKAQWAKTKKAKSYAKQYEQTKECKARRKLYRQSEAGKAVQQRYKAKHPKHREAQEAVNRAVKKGILPKVTTLKCSCGNQARHYHHHKGYAKKHQLDVIPICHKCHNLTRSINLQE